MCGFQKLRKQGEVGKLRTENRSCESWQILTMHSFQKRWKPGKLGTENPVS